MSSPDAAVIVRSKDSSATIAAALESLRRQSTRAEIIVVDSGSTDATLDIAAASGARVVSIPTSEYTPGRALNAGVEATSAPLLLALSSHTVAPDERWIERCVTYHADPRVAGCSGLRYMPDSNLLLDPVRLDASRIREHPYWGFSNTASSWARSVWEQMPFDEDMAACEDKEWSWRVTDAGYLVVIDPRLAASGHHRIHAGARALFRRSRVESRWLASRIELPPVSLRQAFRSWWDDLPVEPLYPLFFYRANPFRIAERAGRYLGERDAARLRRPRR